MPKTIDSGKRLTTHCNGASVGNGQAIRNRKVRLLRQRFQKAPMVEKVLQQQMPMVGLGKEPSTIGGKSPWGWKMSEIESLLLPNFSFGSPSCCTYCGCAATQKDHVIAVSYQSISKKHRFSGTGPWCWACGNCNRSLSNRYFDSFKDRCEWVQWLYESKAKPIEWHIWELGPLDHNLRSHIRAEMERRKQFRGKADFYGSRDFYLNLESLIWEVSQLRNSGIGAKFLASYFSSILRDISEIYRP